MKTLLRGMRADTPEAQAAIQAGEMNAARHRKYSLQLLDESVRVASEVGPAEAARQTGVNIQTIKKHVQRRNRANGKPAKGGNRKYPDAIKRKVIEAILRYRENTQGNVGDCAKRAAVNHGLEPKAGVSIWNQYQQGTFVL